MVGVFHRIGEPNREAFTNSIDQITGYHGTVTFDGIYESVFEYRLHLAAKAPILFITGNQIGREGYCNKEQLLELQRLGFTLAWHGWSHRRLTELTWHEKRAELSVPDFIMRIYAYPHGEFDEDCKEALSELDYQSAYSTTQGDDSRYALYREYL